MVQKGIGRNAPCPCGSGKKFKKCCLGKDTPIEDENAKINKDTLTLPPHEEIDYGKPMINEVFFQKNHCHDLSAPRLVYSNLLSPEIERLAARFSRQFVKRGQEEADRIKKTEDVEQLIIIMKNVPDPLNHIRLCDKLVRKKRDAIPLIIQELKKPQHDSFYEMAVRIIHASKEDYSGEIIEIIKYHQRDAYAVSLLCMLLGFYNNSESVKLLWDYFHYFKKKWPQDTLSDGPLLGLEEIRARNNKLFADVTIH